MRIMGRIFILLSVLALGLLSGCGAPMRIYSDVDESGTFNTYSTYSFMDFTEGNKKTIPGMELERIRVAFARELEQRGLTFTEGSSDVSVKITVYHREAVDPYYYHPYRRNYMERAIAVDMYDNLTRRHVWHCAAVGELIYDPAERAERLPEVAKEIFQKYPVQVTGGV
jgi:hypothetical protein